MLLLGSCYCLFLAQALAQISATEREKIDSLFQAWNAPGHPGGAVGIMRGEDLLFSEAYGLASLEYRVPNTVGTIFNTGSVSKQFTAMGIVVLEERGKLSFDDPVQQYVPALPDFGSTITIRHLLHHTSGLRSLHALFGLAGWRGDDSRSNADLDRILQHQRELNFEPGSDYLYCNTGYMLMANIIENISGEPFPDWMKANIFDPLGLVDTYVEDKYNRVVANNATSYSRIGKSDAFEREVEYWGYVGSGNMHSTVRDLLRWLSNFYAPQPGWASAFTKMQTLDPLNDGTPNDYAFGVVISEFIGHQRIGHGGAIGGFRANVQVFPEEELSLVVLTNYAQGDPGAKVNAVARILLEDHSPEPAAMDTEELLSLDKVDAEKYSGWYWNPRAKYSLELLISEDTLTLQRGRESFVLLPTAEDRFRVWDDNLRAELHFPNSNQFILMRENSAPDTLLRYRNDDRENPDLSVYVGRYYSPELKSSYRLLMQEGTLKAYHIRHGYIDLQYHHRDVLEGNYPLGTLEFHRDQAGRITGLRASNGRVRNLWMQRESVDQ